MQLRRPIKGEDKRQKGKRFASLQVRSEQGKYKGKDGRGREGFQKRKKKPTGEHSTGLERLQTNDWLPMLPVSKRRTAQSEVPHCFHLGKYSCLHTLLMLHIETHLGLHRRFAQTIVPVETFTTGSHRFCLRRWKLERHLL